MQHRTAEMVPHLRRRIVQIRRRERSRRGGRGRRSSEDERFRTVAEDEDELPPRRLVAWVPVFMLAKSRWLVISPPRAHPLSGPSPDVALLEAQEQLPCHQARYRRPSGLTFHAIGRPLHRQVFHRVNRDTSRVSGDTFDRVGRGRYGYGWPVGIIPSRGEPAMTGSGGPH